MFCGSFLSLCARHAYYAGKSKKANFVKKSALKLSRMAIGKRIAKNAEHVIAKHIEYDIYHKTESHPCFPILTYTLFRNLF